MYGTYFRIPYDIYVYIYVYWIVEELLIFWIPFSDIGDTLSESTNIIL